MRPSGLTVGWLAVSGLCLMAAPLLHPLLWIAIALDVILAVLLVADATTLRQSAQISGRREHEAILSLGTANLVTVVIDNPTPFPFRLALRDAVPDQCEVDTPTKSGYLSPYGSLTLTYHLTPLQRGEQHFGPLTTRFKTSLGLWLGQRVLAEGNPVKIYPNIQQTRQEQILSRRQRARQMGLRAMRLQGQGREFESLRDYLPDDELRRVDWKASARRGNLVTRLYDVEHSQQIVLALDLGRTMASHLDYMTKLDFAINASVLLTYVSRQSQDRVGLLAFAEDVISYSPPTKSGGQLPLILEGLYPLQPRKVESDYRRAFTYLSNRLRKRSLVIIFTDLIDPDSSRRLMDSLSLLHPRHLVLCVALSDYELKGMLSQPPTDQPGLYLHTMATTVLQDRQLALAELHQRGILTVDATPSDLSVAVVNRYLAIKREGRM